MSDEAKKDRTSEATEVVAEHAGYICSINLDGGEDGPTFSVRCSVTEDVARKLAPRMAMPGGFRVQVLSDPLLERATSPTTEGAMPWTDDQARRYGEIPAHLCDRPNSPQAHSMFAAPVEEVWPAPEGDEVEQTTNDDINDHMVEKAMRWENSPHKAALDAKVDAVMERGASRLAEICASDATARGDRVIVRLSGVAENVGPLGVVVRVDGGETRTFRADLVQPERSTDYAPPGPNQLNVVLSFSDLELLGMALETERAMAACGRLAMLTELRDRLAKAWTDAGVAAQKRSEG